MRKLWALEALLLGLLVAGILPAPALAAQRDELAGALSGVVYELTPQGAQPVAGAQVELLAAGFPRRLVQTDLQGRFGISGLPSAVYKLVASKAGVDPGYVDSYYRAGGASFGFLEATPVELAAGQSVQDLAIRLLRRSDFSGSISGQVRRAADALPVSAGLVIARATFSAFQARSVLGPNGGYRLERLPPGNYFVTVLAPGHARQIWPDALFPEAGQIVTVPPPLPGGAVSGINFSLHPGGSIAGTVRRRSNPAVRVHGATVVVVAESGRRMAVETASADGEYRMDFLPLGTYRVAAWVRPAHAENLSFDVYQEASTLDAATPVILSAASPVAASVDLALPDGGVLQGAVTDARGQPIAGALVTAHPEHNPLGLAFSAPSTLDGTYRIEKLAAGRHVVQAAAPGHVREFYADVLDRQRAVPVAVAAGALSDGIDFELEPGRSLSGTVRLGGAAVAGARVLLRSDTAGFERSSRTGANGVYRIGELPAVQDARLIVLAPEAAPAQVFPVDLRTADRTLDVDLERGRALGGLVVSVEGIPIAGAVLELSHPSLPSSLSSRTDANGRFRFEHLPSIDGYRVVAGAADHARSAAAGISLALGDRLDLRLELGPGRSIEGRVTLEGSALEGIRVTAHSTAGGIGASARTAVDGSYVISGLAAAPDHLVVAGRDALQAVPYPERIDLRSASATGIDIDIPAGRSLSGRVTSGGAPLAGARVVAWSPSARRGGVAMTDIQGSYSIANLSSAPDYQLMAVRPGFAPQFYVGAASPSDALEVDLSSGSAAGLDFELVAGVSLAGSVRSAANQPVPGAFVHVTAAGKVVGSARAGADGELETTPVAPGVYDVVARAAGQPGAARLSGVSVGSEPVQGLLLSFQPGGAIEGTLSLSTGMDPAAAASTVIVLRAEEREFAGLALAAADGGYRIDGLLAGSYLVTARADGHLPQAHPDASTLEAALPVSVAASETTSGVDFLLPVDPNGGASGSVSIRAGVGGLAISSCSVSPGVWTSKASVTAAWEAVEGALGYNVLFDMNEDTLVAATPTLAADMTSVTSETLSDGIYYAHVRSFELEKDPETGLPLGVISQVDHAGPFLLDTTPPPPPEALSSVSDTGQIALSWLNPQGDLGGSGLDEIQALRGGLGFAAAPSEGLLVYRNAAPQAGAKDGFVDTGLSDGLSYFYSVFAVDAAGNVSLPGAQHSSVPAPLGEDAQAPEAPAGVQVMATETEVVLLWQNPQDADLQGIEIRYSTNGFASRSSGEVIADLRGVRPGEVMSFVHFAPGPGTHYYSIYAYDGVPNYSQAPAQVFIRLGGQVPASGWPAGVLTGCAVLAAGRLRRRRRSG
jgi:hypothetical protein